MSDPPTAPPPPRARFQLLSDLHLELPPKPADYGKPIIFTRPAPAPAAPAPTPLARLSRLFHSKPPPPAPAPTPTPAPAPTPPTQGTSYTHFPIPPSAPYLLLAGDIGNLSHLDEYTTFLRAQAAQFTRVFLVLGNHEFYHLPGGHAEGLALAGELERRLGGKLTVLSRTRVDLVGEGVTVLGCTLWSRISGGQRERIAGAVSDFRGRGIRGGWSVEAHEGECEGDISWLRAALGEIEDEDREGRGAMGAAWGRGGVAGGPSRWRVLVATHHAPTFWKTCKPAHEGRGFGSAFCTELVFPEALRWWEGGDGDNPTFTWDGHGTSTADGDGDGGLITWKGSERIAAWAFGHTHFCTDFVWQGESAPPRSSGGGGGDGVQVPPRDGGELGARNLRVVANQRGYWISDEDRVFDPAFVVEV